jgi:cytochrome c556
MVQVFGRGVIAALAVGVMVAAGGALAHDLGKVPNTPGGRAAAARHDNFKKLGGAFKAANDELKKDAPNKAVILASANQMKALSGQIPSWFPRGSGPESRANTDAKPEIWRDAAGFAAAASRNQAEINKFQQLAAGGDMGAVAAQAKAVGASCKGCHEKYRVPEKK